MFSQLSRNNSPLNFHSPHSSPPIFVFSSTTKISLLSPRITFFPGHFAWPTRTSNASHLPANEITIAGGKFGGTPLTPHARESFLARKRVGVVISNLGVRPMGMATRAVGSRKRSYSVQYATIKHPIPIIVVRRFFFHKFET